jgi:formate-dependent phosphoribosylglycinamide formyltransferase (GAR transformylase)
LVKKILVIGALAQHASVIKKVRFDLGYYVVVVDNVVGSPGKKEANEYRDIDIFDIDALERLCNEIKVDGVINYCVDPAQKIYHELCNRLNLPCYGDHVGFDIMTNKDRFKDACKESGVMTIPGGLISLSSDNADIEYPAVIKPVDGRASKGISFIDDKSDLEAAINHALSYSKRKIVLYEKINFLFFSF